MTLRIHCWCALSVTFQSVNFILCLQFSSCPTGWYQLFSLLQHLVQFLCDPRYLPEEDNIGFSKQLHQAPMVVRTHGH
jgi:hypothetical protein